MRRIVRIAALLLAVLGAAAATASAATTAEQLVQLSKAGLSDDILVALIETDGSRFQLSADDILDLHQAGLSDTVIRAMQATARSRVEPAARTRVDDAAAERHATAVAPPTVINVTQTVTTGPARSEPATTGIPYYSVPVYAVPVAVPFYVATPRPAPRTQPVYWGWGGQRRPDSLQDAEPGRRSSGSPKQ